VSGQQRWLALRVPAAAFAVVVLLAWALAALTDQGSNVTLDPGSAAPTGGRALATLLAARAVTVHVLDPGTPLQSAATVFVPDGADATLELRQAPAGTLVVLISPGADVLSRLGVSVVGSVPVAVRSVDCSWAAANVAGPVDLGGAVMQPRAGRSGCYPAGPGVALAVGASGGNPVDVLAGPDPLTNARLGRQGNAALGLGLLGSRSQLDWIRPGVPPVGAPGRRSVWSLLPDRVKFAGLQLAIAAGLAAAWRARRFGRLVVEPLPVVVPATETVQGWGRLYRIAAARDRAAEALRAAARRRLGYRLGLATGSPPAALTAAVAARSGQPASAVGGVLYGAGAELHDDGSLVRLAAELDAIEERVR
jgi:hypothetical protein